MTELDCNFWLERAVYRCITTTAATTPDGLAVLDSPLAIQAAQRYTGLDVDLGRTIASRGSHVYLVRPDLISFPIQQYQWSGPTLQVIERSARELAALVGDAKTLLPRPGCDTGKLAWEDVAKVLAFVPDNIFVVQHT